MEDPLKLNRLKPTIGTDDGRSLLRLTPVVKCSEKCVVYHLCEYEKAGKCSLESQYLNVVWRNIVNPNPEKGIADQLNDIELMQIDFLISLYHQRIQLEKLRLSLEHSYTTEDKKGSLSIHPVYAALTTNIKNIMSLMNSLKLSDKWEKKFGAVKNVGGPSLKEMMEKGDPGYHKEISK